MFLENSSTVGWTWTVAEPANLTTLGSKIVDNEAMIELTLYSREDCGLCEVAQTLLDALANDLGYRYHTVDIDRDLTLIQRYGERVPVLAETHTGLELGWPFTAEDLELLIGSIQT